MTRYLPHPVVAIDGVDQISTVGPDGPAGQIVLDDFTLTWGRGELLEQPTPATGTVRIFDATRTWATRQDLRGRPVVLRADGLNIDTPVAQTFFRGRIGQDITVHPHTVTHTDPVTGKLVRTDGALVELPIQSLLVDLANTVPTVAWPEESLGARAARVAGLAAAVLPGGIDVRNYWQTPNVWPVTLKNQRSLLEHIEDLFDSSGGDRYIYHPESQSLYFSIRRNADTPGVAKLVKIPPGDVYHDRSGKGVFVASLAFTLEGHSGNEMYLDSGLVEYDEGLTAPARVTRVQVTHPDGTDPSKSPDFPTATSELKVPKSDEALFGVRAARLESVVTWNAYADQAAADLLEMVTQEGAMWRLSGPLRYSTKRTGGFDTAQQAVLLMRASEHPTNFYLQGSCLPDFGVRPCFALIGGRIGYRDGGWEMEYQTLSVSTEPVPQHPITWEEIDDGSTANEVRWYDGDHPNGMHESLTLDDLYYVPTGLGVSTAGPDQGWDYLQ